MYEDLLRATLKVVSSGDEILKRTSRVKKERRKLDEKVETFPLDSVGVFFIGGKYEIALFSSKKPDVQKDYIGSSTDETEAVETARKLASALDINFKGLVEGKVPDDYKDPEDKKIEKLTEQDEVEDEDIVEPPEEEPEEEEVPEIKRPEENEAPEITKEYIGNTEDINYYLISEENDAGEVSDLKIVDQEGVEKFSARASSIPLENIPEFLYVGIHELKIADIEFGIFDKYLYPAYIEDERGEEEEAAPEEMEELPEEPGEEPEEPRESKKNESVDVVENLKCPECGAKLELVNDWLSLAEDKKEVGESKKNLKEMKFTDHENNSFNVFLVDDGSTDTVIDVNGKEFRFDSEFASMWRNEEGELTEEGLKELALDALSNMEEDDYNQLVAASPEEENAALPPEPIKKGTEYESKTNEALSIQGVQELFASIDPNFAKYMTSKYETPREAALLGEAMGLELSDKGREALGRNESKLTKEEAAKYGSLGKRGKKKKENNDKESKTDEGYNKPGVRTGTGPAKRSLQRKKKGNVGKRKERGEKCPKESKTDERGEDVSFMKKVFQVDYEEDGENKSTRVMAFDDSDAKKEMEKKPGITVVKVTKVSKNESRDMNLTRALLEMLD